MATSMSSNCIRMYVTTIAISRETLEAYLCLLLMQTDVRAP